MKFADVEDMIEHYDIENAIAIDTLKTNYERKGLYLRFEKPSKVFPKIKAEPRYLRQVFINIIDNAEKYTLRGGTTITISKKANHLITKISDTGIGISKDDQRELFQKFSRGEKADQTYPGGSDLGLYPPTFLQRKPQPCVCRLSKGNAVGLKNSSVKRWEGVYCQTNY